MRASPAVGWIKVHSSFIKVVFPAPLGPNNPKISPSLTVRFTWSTAGSAKHLGWMIPLIPADREKLLVSSEVWIAQVIFKCLE